MNTELRRDCRRFAAVPAAAMLVHRFLDAATPTVTAYLIGDLADRLLALDLAALSGRLPTVLAALAIQVGAVALAQLVLNLLLTRFGFAYDAFLMEKYIRLPLSVSQTADAGEVMERLEEDSSDICWNQATLLSYPWVIVLYAGVFAWAMAKSGSGGWFAMTVLALAALPVLRAAWTGKRQAQLEEAVSGYQEGRKQRQQELYSARFFSKSFGLENCLVEREQRAFSDAWAQILKPQIRMEGRKAALDYLCGYGVTAGAAAVGAILIAQGSLTIGALLAGLLTIPAAESCFQYLRDLLLEWHGREKFDRRLAFFYAAPGEDGQEPQKLDRLALHGVSFAYPNGKQVLRNLDFSMEKGENCRIAGTNGCGKSTLLLILSGLLVPQVGSLSTPAQLRGNTALLEQDGALFSGTIWENLFAPEARRPEARDLLTRLGLERELDQVITAQGGDLSPGERKKVLLARALLRDAPFLLLDEPGNHLDEAGKRALLTLLAGRTGVLIVSHTAFPLPGQAIFPLDAQKEAEK